MKIVNPIAILGEDAACKYLKNKGYTILERNFRKSYGEIDIIAVFENSLIFVEVKTRSSTNYGTPFDAIATYKLNQIIKLAKYYKYVLHPDLPDNLRIDAVGVTVKGGKIFAIEHIENISGF